MGKRASEEVSDFEFSEGVSGIGAQSTASFEPSSLKKQKKTSASTTSCRKRDIKAISHES